MPAHRARAGHLDAVHPLARGPEAERVLQHGTVEVDGEQDVAAVRETPGQLLEHVKGARSVAEGVEAAAAVQPRGHAPGPPALGHHVDPVGPPGDPRQPRGAAALVDHQLGDLVAPEGCGGLPDRAVAPSNAASPSDAADQREPDQRREREQTDHQQQAHGIGLAVGGGPRLFRGVPRGLDRHMRGDVVESVTDSVRGAGVCVAFLMRAADEMTGNRSSQVHGTPPSPEKQLSTTVRRFSWQGAGLPAHNSSDLEVAWASRTFVTPPWPPSVALLAHGCHPRCAAPTCLGGIDSARRTSFLRRNHGVQGGSKRA